jgi:methoxymalonate biosynthesis acyl carrier protein
MTTTFDEIHQFVLTELAPRRRVTTVDADDDLLRKGLIDSLGVTELISFLEERFGIKVGSEDLVPENFRTLATIDALVERKR